MVVKTFALVKKMSDGRQKSERRTTLIKFKATLLPPSITLIKNNFDSTGTGCGLFPESKAKKKFVKSFGDSTTVLNSKVVTIMHIGCKRLLFFLSLSQKKKKNKYYIEEENNIVAALSLLL